MSLKVKRNWQWKVISGYVQKKIFQVVVEILNTA